MIITQTVEIPASRRLTIEIPLQVPAGKARVEMTVIPFAMKNDKKETPPEKAPTPIADSLAGILSGTGDIDLDEIRMERLSKHL
jgi:hypothetical protein